VDRVFGADAYDQFLAFGLAFTIDYGTSKGLGRHDNSISEPLKAALYRSEYSFTVLYNPALMVTKSSILIFYLRLAKNSQFMLRVASYITLALSNIAGVVLTFLNAFQCRPARAAFTPELYGKCFSVVTLYLCSAPVNIITDIAILVLPLPVLTRIQLPRREKLILVFTFSLGIFATVIDIIRIYYLQQAMDTQRSQKLQDKIGNTSDFAWTASMSLMWSDVEVNVGIICACIPTLRPLCQRMLPAILSDRLHSKSKWSVSFGSQVMCHSGHRAPTVVVGRVETHPRSSEEIRSHQDGDVETADFITTPSMDQAALDNQTTRLHATHRQDPDNSVHFGFIDLKHPKPMLTTTGKESLKYCSMVTTLFFLWGFSSGLLISLVNHMAGLVQENLKQQIGLTSAYYSAYLFGPLTVGQWVLRRGGFKPTFICGLAIYGIGTLIFWPSAVLASFPGFMISQFVVAFGLSILETAANPFLALCGPPQYAEFRLLLAQGVQSIASVSSQVLAQRELSLKVTANSLIDVQWTYLAIALFTVILALVLYYMRLPEAADADLQALSEQLPIPPSQTFFSTKVPLIWITLALAIFSQFCYTSAQESMFVWQGLLLEPAHHKMYPAVSIGDYELISQGAFALGRLICAPLCLVVRPRLLLLIAFILCTISAILTMSLKIIRSGISVVTITFFFFEGPLFPLIFAIGLRGMGRWTKWAAAGITASVCGGALFPFVMYLTVYHGHKDIHYSFCVVVALVAFGTIFPAYLILVPKAGRQIDPVPIRAKGVSMIGSNAEQDGPGRSAGRWGKRFSAVLPRIRGVRHGRVSELPTVARRERERPENLAAG
jgi:fucose permease